MVLAPPAPAADFHDAGHYLPQGILSPWRQSGPVTHAQAGDLAGLIDGAAAAYQAYGVQRFARTDYRRERSTLTVTAEVYQFREALGAFGYYSQMLANGRDPSTMQPRAVQRGAGGFQSDTQLVFWADTVLVQLTMGDTSEEPSESAIVAAAREALPLVGEALERLLPPSREVPPSPLPATDLVWGGATYLADEPFGLREVGPAWVGHYRTGATRFRLAVLQRASAAEATRTLGRLRGTGPAPVAGLGDEAFTAHTPSQGDLLVARRGAQVLVVGDPVSAEGAASLTAASRLELARAALAAVQAR